MLTWTPCLSSVERAGKTSKTIRSELGQDWDIWTMGCPQGESPDEMRDRCDRMIKKIVDLAGYAREFLSFSPSLFPPAQPRGAPQWDVIDVDGD